MADTLLDYAFTVNPIVPLPAASAAYIKQALSIVKPKDGVAEAVVLCTSKAQVQALTDNADVLELFNAGMNAVYVLPIADIADAEALIEASKNKYFTVLVSRDFNQGEIGSLNVGTFKGIVAYSFDDEQLAKAFATASRRCGFYGLLSNGAKNMFYAFGKFLSSTSWRNQQYIEMPYDDAISDVETAKAYFNDGVSFVLNSEQYGKRLAFFAAGKQAITAPYIYENLTLDAQSAAVSYIALNNPDYTITEASLIEDEVQQVLNRKYVSTGLVVSANVSIELINDNWRAAGVIAVPSPKALWGIDVDLIQGEAQ
ncbi:MAG: hypothetical protein LBD46_06600 [Endomicrobium sp.]|jgi:hypothetical protein|nr:hypothetical protein [Endomicrobium sp.]